MTNRSIIILSLVLAVGVVWIKGQERIQRRPLTNVKVTVDNIPAGWMLPEPWAPPRVSLTIQGPRTTVELPRTDVSNFRIDLAELSFPESGDALIVLLRDSMFRTNLEPTDRARVSVLDETIKPRQVKIQVFSWNVDAPFPSPPEPEANQILIPLFKAEKDIPIKTPTVGKPPEGYKLEEFYVTPSSIRLTGPREALDRIGSVSTQVLDLGAIPVDTQPIYLPLEIPAGTYDIQTAGSELRGVTVTVTFSQ
ncbi:MAG: YbbR-like domain-containing protein [Candidatus Hinthialibacter antarcticus]|nr:YbbR-like domain-containing protein [Candidatus Hinthialibacter antarcticus]